MLKCEGYKMFRGTMRITPLNGRHAYAVNGVWLYKPDVMCWYCKGSSYPEEICEVLVDETC